MKILKIKKRYKHKKWLTTISASPSGAVDSRVQNRLKRSRCRVRVSCPRKRLWAMSRRRKNDVIIRILVCGWLTSLEEMCLWRHTNYDVTHESWKLLERFSRRQLPLTAECGASLSEALLSIPKKEIMSVSVNLSRKCYKINHCVTAIVNNVTFQTPVSLLWVVAGKSELNLTPPSAPRNDPPPPPMRRGLCSHLGASDCYDANGW